MSYRAYFSKKQFHSLLLAGSLTSVITFLVLLSDTLIVGNIVGTNGISGIALVTPLYAVVAFFSGIIGMGAVYSYQNAMGKMDKDHADRIWGMSLILAIAFGVVACFLMLLLRDFYLDIMDVSQEVRIEAANYWKYEQFVVLLGPVFFLLSEMVFADGDEWVCTLSNICQVVGNIAFSIIACNLLGTEGASLGSLIGSVLSISILCVHFSRKINSLHFVKHFSFKDLKRFVKFALNDSIIYLCLGVAFLIMTKFSISRFGDGVLPVVTIVQNIIELILVFDGVGAAFMPLANVYVGENNFSRESGLANYAQKWALLEGILASALCFIFANHIPGLYDVNDPDLVSVSAKAIRILSPSLLFSSILFFWTSHYVAIGRENFASFMTFLQNLVLMAILPIPLCLWLGMEGLWWGCAITPLVALVVMHFYGFAHRKCGKFPWLVKDSYEIHNFDIDVSPESVVNLREEIGTLLDKKHVCSKSLFQAKLLIEDTILLTLEKNPEKKLIAEVSLTFREKDFILVFRNNGPIFDVTDADGQITSFRSNVVYAMMSKINSRQYLMTSGFNRQMFTLPI